MNFWEKLSTPFLAVAPMADVTDAAFRRLIAKYSAHEPIPGDRVVPVVMWTEFVSADGLVRALATTKHKLLADLLYTDSERPVVAQLFSSNEDYMEQAAALCRSLGFDGVDINMGCPDRTVEKQGCGAAMIKNPAKASAIIRAAKRGAKMGDVDGIPISVKTRLGYTHDELESWLPHLLSEAPAALTVHARTRNEMSKVPARWDRIARAVEIRNALGVPTRIIGNGDVLSREDGLQKIAVSGADGAMVGRALFGNPWFFHPRRRLPRRLIALPTHGIHRDTIVVSDTVNAGVEYISLKEQLRVLVEHTMLFAELLPHKSFAIMKKHYKAYVSGFDGAKELRHSLMEAAAPSDVAGIVRRFLLEHSPAR